ncbi:uncharacterized protein LOC18426554 isoform X2 [Amborella trichopoda]|nr:uncharacterized protein LOC18426554 isoform X2 [Amborella trichopoda]|eukprot:XP_020518200.1 uncharacterized protein LOC18426554 isoform X2 [Amborella trichopoda]
MFAESFSIRILNFEAKAMKSRSHRLVSAEQEDWGDGSWTVDCVCGVNFDDGDEMVDCDECGVWVHTRCSRFVKGETSFTCDKCKGQKNRKETEETEVAQLLVELPTKTMGIEPNYNRSPPSRLWVETPLEQKVHVQGVPGGDPELLRGLSSVFTSELWKCTGYVPKKFNFQYKEFTCWEDGREPDTLPAFGSQLGLQLGSQLVVKKTETLNVEEDNENPVDRGADVLFSLSKEGLASENSGREKASSPKEVEGVDVSRDLKIFVKGDRSKRGHSLGKRRRDEFGGFKDGGGKKKGKGLDGERENKSACLLERGTPLRASGSTPIHSSQKQELCTGDFEVAKLELQDSRSEIKQEMDVLEPDKDGVHGNRVPQETVNKPKHILVIKSVPAGFPNEMDDQSHASEPPLNLEAAPTNNAPIAVQLYKHDSTVGSMKEEDMKPAVDSLDPLVYKIHHNRCSNKDFSNSDSSNVQIDSQTSTPSFEGQVMTVPHGPMILVPQDSNGVVAVGSLSKAENDQSTKMPPSPSSNCEIKLEEHSKTMFQKPSETAGSVIQNLPTIVYGAENLTAKFSPDHLNPPKGPLGLAMENLSMTSASRLPEDRKLEDVSIEVQAVGQGQKSPDRALSTPIEAHPPRQESEEPLGLIRSQSPTLQENSSQHRDSAKSVLGLIHSQSSTPHDSLIQHRYRAQHDAGSSKLVRLKSSPPAPSSHNKPVGGVAKNLVSGPTSKSSLGASKVRVSNKSSPSGTFRSSDGPAPLSKPPHLSKLRARLISSDVPKDDDNRQSPIAATKQVAKNAEYMTSHTKPGAYASASGCNLDGKEQVSSSSYKASTQNASTSSGSGELAVASPSQNSTSQCDKQVSSASYQKGEKPNQPGSQTITKASNPLPPMHPPPPAGVIAALSDEELALLLHQELNSSPRVPRVPRMRHGGGIPQLASQTTTSGMSVKRHSTSAPSTSNAMKDQTSAFRRRGKEDTSKDSSRNIREPLEEIKRTDKLPPDERRHDPGIKTEDTKRRESPTASSTCHSSSIDANDQSHPSICSVPGDFSDDNVSALVGNKAHALPGISDGILNKTTRISYEDICNAALTTNLTRKKRKVYSSTIGSDNEECEGHRVLNLRDDKHEHKLPGTHTRNVPRGKRRQSGRLIRRGKGLLKTGHSNKTSTTDEEYEPFCPSSEATESMSNEENVGGIASSAMSCSDEIES